MKIEGLNEASIKDLERLVDFHKKTIVYLLEQYTAIPKGSSENIKVGLNKILNHEREILAIIETELDERLIEEENQNYWNDGDCDPSGGYGPSSHV